MQKLNDVTDEERRVIEELYSVRAVPEHKISRVLKDEFGISLSTAKVQRLAAYTPEKVLNLHFLHPTLHSRYI